MPTHEQTPIAEAGPAKLAEPSAEDQAEISRLDVLIAESQQRHTRSFTPLLELKWLLLLSTFMLIPLLACALMLPPESRATAVTYASIIGFTLAGWGVVRAWRARRSGEFAAFTWVYLPFFLMNFLIHVIVFAGTVRTLR